NSWVTCWDNLSKLPIWLSDALCRLATGGAFATRQLYTDDEEILFKFQRPCIINGIEEVATRSDLIDRTLMLTLPPISPEDRIPEQEFWEQFYEARPKILGALLDAVSGALRRLPTVYVDQSPRMADFARWATAGEAALGMRPGEFLKAYEE